MLWAVLTIEPSIAASYSENAVKAAFIYRFSSYVEWPTEQSAAKPFTIAVMGDDAVFAELQRLVAGLSPQDKPTRVMKIASGADLDAVDLLFVGRFASPDAGPMLSVATSRPILTVTDGFDGLARGSIIAFIKVGLNVRFEVSLSAAQRSGLRIRSGLLSVAARVEGAPRAGVACEYERRKHLCVARVAGLLPSQNSLVSPGSSPSSDPRY